MLTLLLAAASVRLHGAAGVGGARQLVSAGLQPCKEDAELDWGHPLFRAVDRDLQHFDQLGGITLRHIEQAYCQPGRASMRVQVVNGRAYVVGESWSFETRLPGIKRQLLAIWLKYGLPEGLDPGNAAHAHAVLAPDWCFAEWLETRTLSWAEMLPLLLRAGELQPWESRTNLLFFRGAPTGTRSAVEANISAQHIQQLDVQIIDWVHADRAKFVTLADHCAYKMLLHLLGSTYSARLM
ncbi:hypothetical protein ABPG75_009444 [Micractinium tetrahymenae]